MKKKDISVGTETLDAAASKKEANKKKLSLELIRFFFVGVLCTVIDFALQYVIVWALSDNLSAINEWTGYVSFAIAVTVGFVISCCVNFVLSRTVVFKNVDKSINTKTAKAFWTYFFLAVGGWLIGLALQEAGVFLCNYLWQLDISLDIANVSWGNLLETGGLAFWAFLVIFVIKTIVTLIYNYTTRKLIIFKAPKEEQVENEKAAPAASETTAQTYSDPSTRPCTPESLQKIVHEELLSYYGKSQLVINEDEARSLMKEELDRFWKSHPSTRK